MQDDATFFTWCAETTQTHAPSIVALAVEASHRRFFRVQAADQPTRSWVAMNSPPELEHNEQFVTLAEVFAHHGIPVPRIISSDLERGFVLMTDLGGTELAQTYDTDLERAALTDAVTAISTLQTVRSQHIPAYDQARLSMEFDLFEQWLLLDFMGRKGAALAASGADILRTTKGLCIDTMLGQPQVCVHRDFHCRNLLFNDNQLGVVDFQDALIGPGLYDIASLLRDCYYRHDEPKVDHYLQLFLQHSPHFDAAEFIAVKRAFDLTAIQRQVKALGIFARLHLRDGKSSHLVWLQPVLQSLLMLAQRYPETEALGHLLDAMQKPLTDKLATLE